MVSPFTVEEVLDFESDYWIHCGAKLIRQPAAQKKPGRQPRLLVS
jgi:hypothetical protein